MIMTLIDTLSVLLLNFKKKLTLIVRHQIDDKKPDTVEDIS